MHCNQSNHQNHFNHSITRGRGGQVSDKLRPGFPYDSIHTHKFSRFSETGRIDSPGFFIPDALWFANISRFHDCRNAGPLAVMDEDLIPAFFMVFHAQ
jgi:hypothetical protein